MIHNPSSKINVIQDKMTDQIKKNIILLLLHLKLKNKIFWQGSANCAHTDSTKCVQRVCQEVIICTKLYARKSTETPLGSTLDVI